MHVYSGGGGCMCTVYEGGGWGGACVQCMRVGGRGCMCTVYEGGGVHVYSVCGWGGCMCRTGKACFLDSW